MTYFPFRSRLVRLFIAAGFAATTAPLQAADPLIAVYTSPSGKFRIEQNGDEAWLISTSNPAERAKLPPLSGTDGYGDRYVCSPNEEWISGEHHVGSCLGAADLYHRISPVEVEGLKSGQSFDDAAWAAAAKLRVHPRNYAAEGSCAMSEFVAWSADSTRLLMDLRGGEEKRNIRDGYVYFNTRTETFEVTEYLRQLKKKSSELLMFAEPTGAPPPASELKANFERLERELRDASNERLARADKRHASFMRANQRVFIEQRDAGLKLYLNSVTAGKKEQRRLQFLASVTAARLAQQHADEEL